MRRNWQLDIDIAEAADPSKALDRAKDRVTNTGQLLALAEKLGVPHAIQRAAKRHNDAQKELTKIERGWKK